VPTLPGFINIEGTKWLILGTPRFRQEFWIRAGFFASNSFPAATDRQSTGVRRQEKGIHPYFLNSGFPEKLIRSLEWQYKVQALCYPEGMDTNKGIG